MRAKTYDIATINGSLEFDFAGEYFKLLSAPDAVDVELLSDGNQALHAAGASAGFYQRVRFNKVRITHSAVQTIRILVAPGEGGSDSFTGDFNLTDRAARLVGIVYGALGQLVQKAVLGVNALVVSVAPSDWLTDENAAFFRGAASPNIGGQFSYVQLKNPAASGKYAYVDRVNFAPSAVSGVRLVLLDADAATDVGAGFSKDQAGAAGVTRVRYASAVGLPGTLVLSLYAPAQGNSVLEINPPIRLAAGQGIALACETAATVLSASWQWRERAV